MFLIDKYDIKDPWDVMFNHDIYKRLLRLDSLNSWYTDSIKTERNFDNLPNILIHGKEGSGKKSLVKLFLRRIYGSNLKKLNVKYIISGYGSNNIEVEIPQSLYHIEIFPTGTGLDKYLVQEVIKEYAAKNLLLFERERTFKIVWIHNIDELSYYAQTALRCTMEKYCKTCKFILTGKQLSKIIEPLRSRCLSMRIPLPNEDDIMRVLLNISINENKFLSLEDYNNIIIKCNNNIKLAVQYLEMNFYGMPITVSWKVYLSDIIKIFNKAIKGTINELHIIKIRDILYKIFITNVNGTEIIKELLNQMLFNLKDKELTYQIIDKCTYYENSLSKGKRTIIHLEAFIFSVLELLNKKYSK
jgi:replication factor C subunit 3/5